MEKWKRRAINLITSIAFGGQEKNSVVPYYPQKTEINKEEAPSLPRSAPESHGISSKRLYNMLSEIEGDSRCNVHNLMVIKDVEVISECSREGYGVNHFHLSHSMTKSVIGMAIGLLYDDGLITLDTRLVDIFPEIPYKDKSFPYITVEHLLTMTSGVPFGEAGSVTESCWSEAFFGSTLKFHPGTEFFYNSMNSYILARIVVELSGMSVRELVGRRIFAPLGIENYFFEIGPENVEKGGWGLYLSTESWAKLGLMFMNGGSYGGKRILSERWVSEASETRAISPLFNGDFNYGYQLWVARESSQVLFNGMLGQNVWMCPDNNIVVVFQSGNNELFQDSPTLGIIRRHLGGKIEDPISFKDIPALRRKEADFLKVRRWVHPLDKHHGLFYFLGLKNRAPYDESWDGILGTYKFPENNSGILPLFVRAMQNNLDTSIDEMSITREGERLWLTVKELEEIHRLEVGLYGYKETVLDFRGERYIVKAIGEAAHEPDGSVTYRVELLYPELPNTLMMSFKKTLCDRIAVSMAEIPNEDIVDSMATRLADSNSAIALFMNALDNKFGHDVLLERLGRTFAPTFVAADKSAQGYENVVAEEEAIVREDQAFGRKISAFVNKYIRLDEDGDGRPDFSIKALFSDIAERLKERWNSRSDRE